MAKVFVKPDVKFPMFPAIYMYIEYAYNKVETYADFVEFINGCLNKAETTHNEVKRIAYTSIASSLYATETNMSFESKAVELFVEKL